MANYYYAYSGHKFGLDCVRRAAALIKAAKKEGIEVNLLVNDFRAGLAARDLGVEGAVTIETILDVDAVAKRGDGVILDTPEDTSMCLEHYAEDFTPLLCVTESCDDSSHHGETLLKPFCKEEQNCIETLLIDAEYFDPLPKEDRTVFFLGDADYEKAILSHRDFFGEMEMDLILGHYFFVKYEDDLSTIFDMMHEPEEYSDLIRSSKRVVTASSQCAVEAKAAGADVIYINQKSAPSCLMEQFEVFGIKVIDGFDSLRLKSCLKNKPLSSGKPLPSSKDRVIKLFL